MNRLDQLKTDCPIRVSYVIPGYPTYAESIIRAKHLLDLGIEILEIGVPFSDPTADGPIIRIATEKAIAGGTTLDTCITFCKEIRVYAPHTPLVLMTYLNPVYQYGYTALNNAVSGLVDGFIIPDCPYEESTPLKNAFKNIHLIPLITLNTGTERMETIVRQAKGFIYLVTIKGTTGGKIPELDEITQLYQQIKPYASIPIIAGFGIKNPIQVSLISQVLDGYVVASEVIKAFDEGRSENISALFDIPLKLG